MVSTSSLLPYLDRQRGPFSIDLLPGSASKGHGRSTDNPFRVLDDSPPFCSLLRADLVTDADTSVQHLFLIKQKDAYTGHDGLSSNQDIDASWVRAPEAMDAGSDRCIWLAAQRDSSGHLQQLPSLFFCSEKSVFFHPPCPDCGHPLELCTSDDLLEQWGLAPYSTSMDRFLYCSVCSSQQAAPVFYTFTPNRYHPPCVRDHQALINGFGSLRETPPPELGFPCPSCPSFSSCFAADPRSSPPIVPFGFYPFFLLIYDEPTLRADDFLALVSGRDPAGIVDARTRQGDPAGAARVEEVMPRFQNRRFLTPEGPAHFAEVLTLKLSFLLEAMEHSFASARPETDPSPLPSGSPGSFWIKLPKKSSSLPLFWDFRVDCFYVGPSARPRVPASLQFSHRVNNFGLFCFFALLAGQDGVADRLDSALQASDGQAVPDWDVLFPPASIFWDAHPPGIPSSYLEAWHASLSLGWAFLTRSPGRDANTFLDAQRRRMQEVLTELRQALFAAPDKAPSQAAVAEPQALLSVMDDIIESWASQLSQPQPEQPPEPQAGHEETLLVSTDSEGPVDQEDTMNIDETRVETVFLSLDDDRAPTTRESPVRKSPEESAGSGEGLEATVFVPKERPGEPEASPGQDEPEATVILKPQQQPQKEEPEATVVLNTQPKNRKEGSEATAVLNSQQQPGEEEPEAGDDVAADDREAEDLDKTVILNTRSRKGGAHGRGQDR
jgi:hypothetical protein